VNTDQIIKGIKNNDNDDIIHSSKNEITYGKVEMFSTSMPIVHKVNKYAEQYAELHKLVDDLFYNISNEYGHQEEIEPYLKNLRNFMYYEQIK
jgi:hypothetical protein